MGKCFGANGLVVASTSSEDISVQRNVQSNQWKGKYIQD